MILRFVGLGLALASAGGVGCRATGADALAGAAGPVVETGVASFYSDALAGRPTASGEPYDPAKATCAHRTLPLGTVVEIQRHKTEKVARCRINDRGPFHEGRIIDLSRSVAESLAIEGVSKVSLRIVDRPEGSPAE